MRQTPNGEMETFKYLKHSHFLSKEHLKVALDKCPTIPIGFETCEIPPTNWVGAMNPQPSRRREGDTLVKEAEVTCTVLPLKGILASASATTGNQGSKKKITKNIMTQAIFGA